MRDAIAEDYGRRESMQTNRDELSRHQAVIVADMYIVAAVIALIGFILWLLH